MDVCHLGSIDSFWYYWGSYPTMMNHFSERFTSHAEKVVWNWDIVFLGYSGLIAKSQTVSMVFPSHFGQIGETWYESSSSAI